MKANIVSKELEVGASLLGRNNPRAHDLPYCG